MNRNRVIAWSLLLWCLLSTALAGTPVEFQARYDRYLSLYREYGEAVREGRPVADLQALGRELETARRAYDAALGKAPAGLIDQPAVPEAVEAGDGQIGNSGQTVVARSAEERAFDALMARLYRPDRLKQAKSLMSEIRTFLATAKNPRLIMDMVAEQAELTYETTRDPKAAAAVLQEYRKKAPTAEAVRMTDARIRVFQVRKKVQAQRLSFDNKRLAAAQAWQKFAATSWLALPVKLARLASWTAANVVRRREAASLKQLIDEYARAESETYAQGTLDAFTHSQLIPANRVTLLANGRSSFARRYALAARAKESIVLQTLLYHNDQAGNHLADLLIERAKAGVDVRVICDDAFSIGRKSNILRKLANGGVQVLINNPILENPLRANFRSHQKLFLVDDEAAVVGGMNIADEYALGEVEEFGWRDTDVEVRGPVVNEIGELFERNWETLTLDKRSERGTPLPKEVKDKVEKRPILPNRENLIPGPIPAYFAEPPVFDDVRVRFVKTFPLESKDDDILDLFIVYLQNCKKEAIFETAYFIPTPALKKAMIDACRRGVRVRILTNSIESNNHPNAGYASRANFEEVMRAGAEIWEWRGAQTLHSKVSLFDGFAATLGAYNVNSRSNCLDSEDVLAIEDRRMAAVFKSMLERDFTRARKVTMADIQAWKGNLGEHLKMDFYDLFKAMF